MKNKSKSKPSGIPRVDPYLEGLMAKLLERLTGLEKRMDIVIAQTAGRPSGGDPPKPFQNTEAKQPPRRDRVLYEAICADCHKICEVPFRPSEDRPVYCKECFAKRKAGGSGNVFPILTPVAMPSKPFNKPRAAACLPVGRETVIPPAPGTPKKTKKSRPVKKAKKKK